MPAEASLNRQLALRLGVGGLAIAIILGAATFIYEMRRIDAPFVEEAVEQARTLSTQLPPRLDSTTRTEVKARLSAFLKERRGAADHFAGAEIYTAEKTALAEAMAEDNGMLAQAVDRSRHVFPEPGETWYTKHIVGGELYLLVLTGLTAPDNSRLGYFEGVYHVSRIRVAGASRAGLRTSILVILSVLATSGLLFPVIKRLNRSLVERSRSLLHANLGAIEMLGNAIAKRDSDTSSHNYRVTLYALRLAEALRLDAAHIRSLLKGAFLHDVGKLAIPDAILLKPGKLDDAEFAIMKTHITHGLDLVQRFAWLKDAAAVVGHHHEKYDGSGYMAGLAGDQIPLAARIFAIADVFDALTSKRPYKEAFPVAQATAIMAAGRGSHFDPALLGLFFSMAGDLYGEFGGREDDGLKHTLRVRTLHYFEEALER
ncbi:HD-GYP domain-containing protein [Paramagnetospirillum magneticum]|uniref:Response regulator n=1 Tax=Paramagnetospirillum magneticum (strain ATCC 700264 / AMB-1) TaxID=342108 RepID=Q2W810_PARM1|nr:HD-GYP domain-containing protein [Paramagnetospirillum magneticum]BAE50015.1 Response regulator [Paramagnetospirillum magneticum AMB-1]